MDFTAIAQFIQQIGFPAALCLILLYYMKRSEEQHKAEMDKMSESLQNNTLALTALSAEIETLVKIGSKHDKDTDS